MNEIFKLVRDLTITLAMGSIVCSYYLMRQPEFVGKWLAEVDITYYSIMEEHWSDCDCTEEYPE
jgi:hypothetical protein